MPFRSVFLFGVVDGDVANEEESERKLDFYDNRKTAERGHCGAFGVVQQVGEPAQWRSGSGE